MFHAWHAAFLQRVDNKHFPHLSELTSTRQETSGSKPDPVSDWRQTAARFEAMAMRAQS